LFYSNLPKSTEELAVYDPLGRLILSSVISNSKGSVALKDHPKGPVFVFCKDAVGGVLEKQTLFIH